MVLFWPDCYADQIIITTTDKHYMYTFANEKFIKYDFNFLFVPISFISYLQPFEFLIGNHYSLRIVVIKFSNLIYCSFRLLSIHFQLLDYQSFLLIPSRHYMVEILWIPRKTLSNKSINNTLSSEFLTCLHFDLQP